jgi:hypothetical protein
MRPKATALLTAAVLMAALLTVAPLSAPPAHAGTRTNCTGNIQHGSRIVNACVTLWRNDQTQDWWASASMQTNSGKVCMRITSVRLYANLQLARTADVPDRRCGGSLYAETLPHWNTIFSGVAMHAEAGVRWTWGDGTCYPSCDPTLPLTLVSPISYTA